MEKAEFKIRLSSLGEKYSKRIEDLESRGFKKMVDWEIIRKLMVYLFNKGLNIGVSVIEYSDFYSCVFLESYIGDPKDVKNAETISVAVITPEDTEGAAYGKADRILIKEYNNYLNKKEN